MVPRCRAWLCLSEETFHVLCPPLLCNMHHGRTLKEFARGENVRTFTCAALRPSLSIST